MNKFSLIILLFSSYLFSGEISRFNALDAFNMKMADAKIHGIREFILNPEAFKDLFKALCNDDPLNNLQSNLIYHLGISRNFYLQNAFFEGMLLSVSPYERYKILAYAGPKSWERFAYTIIDPVGRLVP